MLRQLPLTIVDVRVNFSDGDNVRQHVTQPLRVQEIQVTQQWVVIMQQYTCYARKKKQFEPQRRRYVDEARSSYGFMETKSILLQIGL